MKKTYETPHAASCPTCNVLRDEVAYMKELVRSLMLQNEQMQTKLLTLGGDAADKYHKLKLTEAMQSNPAIANGMMPLDDVEVDEGELAVDNFMSEFTTGRMRL